MSEIASTTQARSRVSRIANGIYQLARGLRDLPRHVSNLEAISLDLQSKAVALAGQIDASLRAGAAIQQNLGEFNRAASNIEAGIAELSAKLSDAGELSDRVGALKEALHGLSGDVEALGRQTRRNMKQMAFLLNEGSPVLAEPDRSDSFAKILGRLESDYPKVFPVWKVLFDNAIPLYQDDPDANLSTASHPTASLFKDWVSLHAYGRLLDIGCGPVPVPHYLDGYDLKLIAGLDPLEEREIHPFQFVRGCAEYLPWPDDSFETVVIATSLDHVISLRKTLSEIRRVLTPTGVVILWLGFVPGGKYFDPNPEGEPVPIDKYHLFHFDRPWFEEIMAEYFVLDAVRNIDIEQSFYVYSA